MPIALVVIGLAMIISAARGQADNLGKQVATDFKSGFADWLAAVMAVGFLGYIPGLEKISRALLVLILLVFIFKNDGVFTQLQNIAKSPPSSDGTINYNFKSSSGSSSSGGGSNIVGGVLGVLGGLL